MTTGRFERARRTVLRFGDGELEVVVAEGFGLRLLGLARLDPDELVPLLFARCRSLHTFGMRTAIDVIWIRLGAPGAATALRVVPAVPPRRLLLAPNGANAALELPPGTAASAVASPLDADLRDREGRA